MSPRPPDLLTELNEVVFRTDAEGKWTYLNAAWERLTGFGVEDTLGGHFLDLVHPEEREGTVQMFMAVISGGANFCHHETRYAHADGTYGWVEVRARVLRDDDGTITANVGTIVDIGDRKRIDGLLADQTRVLELVTRDRPLPDVLGAVATMVANQVDRPTTIMHFPEGHDHGPEDDGLDGRVGVFLTAAPGGEVTWGLGAAPTSGSAEAIPIRREENAAVVGAMVVHGDPGGPRHDASVPAVARGLELAGLAISRSHREADVRRRAGYDPLTSLPNRYLIEDRLQEAMETSHRHGSKVALLILDLDRFKDVNDMLGHDVGDRVLEGVARRLSVALRPNDTIGRLGGDEFVVLVTDIASTTDAQNVAAKLQAVLRPPFEINGVGLDVSASIGIALYPNHGNDLAMLLRKADAAMYRVKPTGGGAALFEPGFDRGRSSYVAQAVELRQAIDDGQLLIEYQPKVDLRDRVTTGVEALVRWRHPTRGVVQPDDFIGLAESTGLMKPLTRWVLETALLETLPWRVGGATPLSVAVNLPASMLRDPELESIAVGAAQRWGVGDGQLQFEVTESALLIDPEAAIHVMSVLDRVGISFALDDFGTGYSSLSYLKRVPARTLKIDKSFLQTLTTDRRDASIVQAVVHLGHDLGIAVVAEGVEDEATLQRITEFGCDEAQGFYLGRPMSADDLAAWLRTAELRRVMPPPN